jgi:hypothetical protein
MGVLGGVSAVQIDASTLRISGRGNGFTDPATIQNYVLLKAAEETKRRGFDLFVILNSSDTTRVGEATFGSASAFGGRGYAWGLGSSFSEPIVKPGEDALVKMVKGAKPPNAPANVFDAAEVLHYLGPSVQGYSPNSLSAAPTTAPMVGNTAGSGAPVTYADLGSLAPMSVMPNFGITGTTITPDSTLGLNMRDPHGALVSVVALNSPASRADVQPGDIIQMFNAHRVESFADFTKYVSQMAPGSTAKLDMVRKGRPVTAEVKP